MRKQRLPEDDDGKVIAPMDVDGMPWYVERLHRNEAPQGEPYKMSRKEAWIYILGALSASILMILAFVAVIALFILLLLHLWS